jgi:hypothetical protein
LRAEPLARVHPNFARRVSAALARPAAGAGVRRVLRGAALGSAVAAGVAGAAIWLLRNDLPVQEQIIRPVAPVMARAAAPSAPRQSLVGGINLRVTNPAEANSSHEVFSYVVPPLSNESSGPVPAALADYVVAHSEVPSSLARASLLSVLVGNPPAASASDNPFIDARR